MKTTIWMLFALLGAHPAHSQIDFGTIVILHFAEDKIIIAADSRENHIKGPPSDFKCKISAIGNETIFTSVGASVFKTGPLSWTNTGVARETMRMGGDPPVEWLGNYWAEVLRHNWQRVYSVAPAAVNKAAEVGKGILTTGLFAKRQDRTIKIGVVGVTLSNGEISSVSYELTNCIIGFCALGDTEVFTEFMHLQSQRARDEVSSWDHSVGSAELIARIGRDGIVTIRLADITIAYQRGDTVGGSIDAVEMQTDGSIRWLARKPNCSEN